VPTEGVQSTLAPGPKLLSRIERFGVTQDDITWSDEQEPIVLRSTKTPGKEVAEAVEYTDTQQTNTLRAEMNSINAYLAQADISCKYHNTNPNDRYLRRIFNNNTFDQGGRLYGGFWQRLMSEIRYEHIRINNDMIAECDYGQMSIVLLYAEAEAQYQFPEGDLYDLSAHGIPQECRPGIKKVMQAIINSPDTLKRLPNGARKHIPTTIRLKDILSAIEWKHPVIYPLMNSNRDMQLFRKESDTRVDVLLTLREHDVVALPIHDAVLVADEDKETAVRVMKEVFRDHTGITPEVTH